ncbi:MAG: glutamate--cysteine ligase [Candidatus Peregrinibacteria bacterium]|nr:glutamate--cysteine ligase [Candidatus Peregrinibacteria bacterium]MDZ4244856.1 glutamate--cysteine ligase [Candidatus Gracilibacteria bacterium]
MLHNLVKSYKDKKGEVDFWLEDLRNKVKGPIYNSVDLRNSGFKIAAIDTNIFPAGFNNLCPNYSKETGILFKAHINKYYPNVKNIIIFPEGHTKNTYYLENVRKLQNIIKEHGFRIYVAHYDSEIAGTHTTAASEELIIHEFKKENDIIFINSPETFIPDIILTNNDFSGGIPEILKNVKIPILPNPNLGWFQRSKYGHQKHYEILIEEFAKLLDVDSWFFSPITIKIENVNFQTKEGFEKIAKAIEELLKQIQAKYNQHNIKETPYVFIKNDSGTYGIAIHHVEKPEEIIEMNRKTRNKLSIGKDKKAVTDIIIQEGIPTVERFKGLTGEPVIYLVGNNATGGFFRLNEDKDEKGNLNTGGMRFTKLCFHEMLGYENNSTDCDIECLEELYFKIAEIASIASGMEMLELEKDITK